jgi:NSS family neurotransmitter:Na+ symporter
MRATNGPERTNEGATEMSTTPSRGMWSSRAGFILAAAGSAVGLGNIWGFPTQVGQGGGAAFVVVYLACILFICLPIMAGEIALGRRTRLSPVGSFTLLAPGRRWWLVGGLGVLAGAGILSFYSVIAGWAVAYVWFTATGAVTGSPDDIGRFFAEFTANGVVSAGLALFVIATTAAVLLGGVRTGIERVTKALMPLLVLLLIALALRAVTLPGAGAGLAYYLSPDLTRLADIRVFTSALGQAFFSLSLGMGCILTYGSYFPREDGIASSALWIVALDTSIALLAGFIVFPVGFSIAGFDPTTSGPGLIFTVLPRLFAELPGGQLFGGGFFLLLSVAALTSTISLLEVPVSHCVDALGWSRTKAVGAVAAVVFVLAIPSALGNGAVAVFTTVPGFGIGFLDLMVNAWNEFALPIGGFLTAIFIGRIWGVDRALEELRAEAAWFPSPKLWAFLIRWICPAGIALILLVTLASML